ncbi:MAG: outer membrane lipoprotein carrier protein LolA [Smithella sp.]
MFLKRNKQLIITVAAIWLFCTLFIFLAPKTAITLTTAPISEVVARLQQKYEKTRDFKAGFIQQTTIKSIKKTDTEEGTVFFKSPQNMLWNYSRPKAKKLVINSRKAWLYLPQEKVAYVQEADNILKSRTLIKFLSGLGKLENDFTIQYAAPQALDKQGNYLLYLIPREKAPTLQPFQVTVDKNTYLILQVSFADALGNTTLLKFSNISTNIGIAEKMFQFQPPKGVSIFNMP